MSDQPKISVVIRVRNEAAFLEKTLTALKLQNCSSLELIVVDNESTDGSREIAERFGAKIVKISMKEFSYGRASNRGFQAATGDVVVLLSAHSLPIGCDFLSTAAKPFVDPRVAAVRLLHIGNRPELHSWMEQGEVLTGSAGLEDVIYAGPTACGCAIRRSIWETLRFDESMASVEDKFWAKAALAKGYIVVKAPAAYLYMRERTLREHVRIMTRDRLEYFRQTGALLDGGPRLSSLLHTLFWVVPKRALRTIVQETSLYCSLKTIPRSARVQPSPAHLAKHPADPFSESQA